MEEVVIDIVKATEVNASDMSIVIQAALTAFILPECSEQGAQRLLNATSETSILSEMREGTVYFLAKSAQRIIGVIGLRRNCHLYHLFVLPGEQKSGIGKRLWYCARDFAINELGANTITVNASFNAVKFYRQLGFEPVSEYRIRGGIKDLPMKLNLS
ncbi:GNAT family N-acetyltransferase [Thalassotalea fusca]